MGNTQSNTQKVPDKDKPHFSGVAGDPNQSWNRVRVSRVGFGFEVDQFEVPELESGSGFSGRVGF